MFMLQRKIVNVILFDGFMICYGKGLIKDDSKHSFADKHSHTHARKLTATKH